MYISLNWINEFVKLPNLAADDLANRFTMATAEVEGVKTSNEHLKVIRVVEIKSLKKHPEADKLNLVTFDTGHELKEVVCGAPNVREGLKVPYAPLGVTLPNGMVLESKKIRGVLSEGMLCSETELGLGTGTSGLMELSNEAKVGATILELLNLNSDTILDVDNKSLTHRPDLWGHYGLAREFAAAYDLPLLRPFNEEWRKKLEAKFNKEKNPVNINVANDCSCRAFWGLSVDGIKVEKTPRWMAERLEAAGMRSINSIVDISNYVMLELGKPLHIYDRAKIEGGVLNIKKAGEELTFKTLDESERIIVPTDTIIFDAKKPVVLAGIMGGENSGVSDHTNSIFIEVANWQAEEVRTTSTRLGLRTDSSARFEKTLDDHTLYETLLRTLDLVLQLNPKAHVVGMPHYARRDLSSYKPLVIKTSGPRIRSFLGHDVTDERLKSLFLKLDFKVEEAGDNFSLTIPSFRTSKDIQMEADIFEEVGRLIGYDNITPVSPRTDILATRLDAAKSLARRAEDFLMLNTGALQVMTYPLIGQKLLEKAHWPVMNEELILVNSLSQDADRMRPSLIPHALQTLSINTKNFDHYTFFELGRTYHPDAKNFANERHELLIGMFDKNETPFLKLANTVEKLLSYLKIPFDFSATNSKFKNPLAPQDWSGLHPHEYSNLRMMGKFQGMMTSLHPLTLRQFKVKGHAAIAVIDLTDFMQREVKDKMKYSPIAKFPSVTFDCTVLVNKDIPAAQVLEALKKVKHKELVDKKIADVFNQSETLNAVTVRSVFEDPAQTLGPELIKTLENAVMEALKMAGHPLKM